MVFTLKSKGSPVILGIIGQPTLGGPFLSPIFYNTLFQKYRLPFVYIPFDVKKESLKNLITTMRLTDVVSLNVTVPFKETVIPFLGFLDKSAKGPNSVNLILKKGNLYRGYNTDGAGWLEALRKNTTFRPKGKRIVILGAGGTARSLTYLLCKAGVKELVILNRSSKHRPLQKYLKKYFRRVKLSVGPIDKKHFLDASKTADLIVNATPCLWKFSLASLPKTAVVSDVIYRPYKTPLIRAAQKKKLQTVDGLWMFCYQAVENLHYWTGRHFKPKTLRSLALKQV